MDRLLTPGSLKKLVVDELPISQTFQPVLQILGLKQIAKGGAGVRYRVLVQDGVHSTSSAMLSSPFTSMVESKAITSNCLIKVTDYTLSTPSNSKKVLCITQLTVVKTGEEVGQKLGDPVPLKYGEQGGDAPAKDANGQPGNTTTAPLRETNSAGSGFYGSKPQSAVTQSLQVKKPVSGSPGTPGGGPVRIYPIASLTPYQNRWTIKCRVTQKSGVRTYSNSRGEGKFFNCVFSDESGEIKATAWKNECDAFFDSIELNKVYLVSKAQLKTANKQFSSVNNDYEMNLSADTRINVCDDEEAASVPTMQFSFVTIEDLAKNAVGGLVDVCGVVISIGDITTIVAKSSQRELMKRDIEVADDTCMSVRLTVWGDEAKNFAEQTGQVVAVKGAKISDWNGRSLSLLSSSQLIVSPDCADAHRLRGWYDSNGSSVQFRSYASDASSGSGGSSQSRDWKTLDCIHSENLGMGDKPDYYTMKGFVAFIKKENCMYTACASDGCNKKVLDNGDGTYRCEKCNKSSPEFKFRLLLQLHVADSMGYHWATAFQDTAEKILGKTAEEMGNMRDNEDMFDFTVKSALLKPYQLTLRSKMESYNDDTRLKTVIVEAKDLDISAYNKRILADVKKMIAQ